MTVHQVSYDLHKPGKDYDGLWSALRRFEHRHLLGSTWLIAGASSAEALCKVIAPFVDQNDRILVSRVDNDRQGWLSKEDWEWIRRHA